MTKEEFGIFREALSQINETANVRTKKDYIKWSAKHNVRGTDDVYYAALLGYIRGTMKTVIDRLEQLEKENEKAA